jgi:hypothetical protein
MHTATGCIMSIFTSRSACDAIQKKINSSFLATAPACAFKEEENERWQLYLRHDSPHFNLVLGRRVWRKPDALWGTYRGDVL